MSSCTPRGTVLAFPPDLVEDAIGRAQGRGGNLRPRDQLAVWVLTRALRDSGPDQLDAEEATLLVLGSLARAFADTGNDDRTLGPGQRLRIERARAILASAPTDRWDLSPGPAAETTISCRQGHRQLGPIIRGYMDHRSDD